MKKTFSSSFSQSLRGCFQLRMMPCRHGSALYFSGLYLGWWTQAAEVTAVRAETVNVYTLRRAGREQRTWLMDSTGKEGNGGHETSHHSLLNASRQETTVPCTPHHPQLVSYEIPEQCTRAQKNKDRSVLSLLYQQTIHQYCISFHLIGWLKFRVYWV